MTSDEAQSRAMLTVFLIVVVDLIGFGVIIPLLPFYAQAFNASPLEVALLMASFSMAQFIAAPWWGRLSDRIGRRPVLLTALAGLTLCYVWLAFAESLAALFAARTAAGFMAGNIAAAFAYAADITTRETRARGMGMVGAAFGVGFMIGPAVGGVLAGADADGADFRTPALAAAGLSAAAFLFGLARLKESLPAETRAKTAGQTPRKRWANLAEALSSPAVRGPLMLIFAVTFVFAGLEAMFAIWARQAMGWGPVHAGWLFAFLGFLSAAVQGGLAGKLAARFGETRLTVAGAVLLALGFAAAPLGAGTAAEAAAVTAALGAAAVGFSLVSPALTALVSIGAPEDMQGGVLGASRSASTLARVGGPAFAGLIYQFIGPNAPFFTAAAVMVLTAAAAPVLARTPAPLRRETPSPISPGAGSEKPPQNTRDTP
ncbi:MAG: MFS transporter [Rhodospirillales bacterium]